MGYAMRCQRCSSRWTAELTPTQFIEQVHPCPDCGSRQTRRAPIPVGGVVVNDAAMKFARMYPYASDRLSENTEGIHRTVEVPTKDGGTIRKAVVESAQHERELCAMYGMRRE